MKKIVSLFLIVMLFGAGMTGWAQETSAPPAEASSEAKKAEAPAEPVSPDRFPVQSLFDKNSYEVEAVADTLEYDKNRNLLVAKGNVVLTHQDIRLTSDYAELDTQTNKAMARGHVIVFKGDQPTVKGSEVYYDFKAHHGNFPDGRFVSMPWRGTGVEVEQKREGLHTFKNCSVTTCSSENPNYEFRAKQATVYAGDKMVVRNVWLYVMGKKVFWVPFMVIPLNLPHVPFAVTAGNNSRYGYYVGVMKGYYINKNLWGQLYADWRSKKGFGAGLRQQYDYGKWAKGDLKLYWTQDKEAPTPGHLNKQGQENPYAVKEERDRGRISWRHRTDFSPGTHLILRYHRVADEYFLQDFFHREHRSEIQPSSFVTLTHNTEKYGVLIHNEKSMNAYEETIEHLPQIRADLKNQPILNENLYNQSQISVDNLTKRFGRTSRSEKVFRSDAASQFYYPLKWDTAKMTPFLGARTTHYTRDKEGSDDHFRVLANAGVDLRQQYYKTMPTTVHKWGIEVNQLRHVFEPNAQVEAVASSLSTKEINTFDAIDQLGSTLKLQFGLDNRLQTKRVVEGTLQRVDLVSMNTYLRYETQPVGRPSGGFTTLGNQVVLRPYSWLLYETRVEQDLEGGHTAKFSQDLIFQRERWRLLFGHRYVSADQLQLDNAMVDLFGERPSDGNQFIFEGQYTINPLWLVAGYVRWNASHGNFEEWQVSATRNLGCDLLLDFGVNFRDSLIESSNREVFFNLRMQSIPGIHLSTGGNRVTVSDPRIGPTVDGSNEQQGYFSAASGSYASRYSPQAYLY